MTVAVVGAVHVTVYAHGVCFHESWPVMREAGWWLKGRGVCLWLSVTGHDS